MAFGTSEPLTNLLANVTYISLILDLKIGEGEGLILILIFKSVIGVLKMCPAHVVWRNNSTSGTVSSPPVKKKMMTVLY